MGVATGCGFKEVYRFPHTTYPYSSCICIFLQQHPYFFVHFLNVFLYKQGRSSLGMRLGSPVITTVQCSICSQLNNKPRVVVTDFKLHHTCSIWLHSLSGDY